MRINELHLKIVALFFAGFFQSIQSSWPLRFSNGGEALILLKQHPEVFAQAYQDKIFLQTYGNLLGRPKLFSRQTPVRYQPKTNFEPDWKVSESKGGSQITFGPGVIGSSPSGQIGVQDVIDENATTTIASESSTASENKREPKEEYIFVKLADHNERWNLASEDERLKDNLANDLSKTESGQSVINSTFAQLIKSPEENEIMKGNANNVNEEEERVRGNGNAELERKEITRRDERANESETEEKEREEELDPIKSETVDEKVVGVHQERQDTEDDGDSYAPFEVVVQLRERTSVRPLVSIERTESGKDKYRSKGYKHTNFRKIERLEETQYFEEEWDKERKVELKENGKVVRDEEEEKIKKDIANHYAKHPGAGHPEMSSKLEVPKKRPEYWDTYKYHAPQLSKDFKINDHFRQWVLSMSK